MNRVFLIGNLAADPIVNYTGTGKAVCRFTLAVQRTFPNAEGIREADFINITAWGKLGENCQKYLKKGRKTAVIGRLQIGSYEAEGQKRYTTDVIADEVEFLPSNRSGSDSDIDKQEDEFDEVPKVNKLKETTSNDDLPF